MGNPIITVKDMSFGYGKDDVLTDVNFIVEEREYVGIIGANGAGKSTLMKLILGQLTPSKGEVKVNTDSIGYVPQVGFHAASNFPANVEEVVLTGLHKEIGMFRFPKKVHRQKAADTLALVGMQDYRKRMLSKLSGGQQQRVLIARALIQNPKLLVLDEPLTGIDKAAGEMLYQLLEKLNKEYGMTIVMVTHNMEQVARYTNRFYHVSNGSVHLDKSSVLCDEVLKDKMIISKPKRYGSRPSSGMKSHPVRQVELPEKDAPYDASYKRKRRFGAAAGNGKTAADESSYDSGVESHANAENVELRIDEVSCKSGVKSQDTGKKEKKEDSPC